MTKSVKCNVTECQYNNNVMCDAPMVEVDRISSGPAHSSDETQCQTFKPKK